MARALRTVSVERGHDPRDFTLVAFGGAAGVHACALATALGMREVLVPHHPGLLSAAGMAHARLARDHALTVRAVDPSFAALRGLLAPLRRRAIAELRAQGASGSLASHAFAQVRYRGQAHEIELPLSAGYRRAFDAAHARLYGHAAPERPVEVVALRLTLTDREAAPGRAGRTPAPRGVSSRRTHVLVWQGRRRRVARHARATLAPGARFAGPALLVEYSSTVLVPPGWRARVDADRNLRLSR
jgi:N-methylhydantoinase A